MTSPPTGKPAGKTDSAGKSAVSKSPPATTAIDAPAIKPYREGDWRPEYYVVRKGDTLYSIALDFGQDYRDLALWNRLEDPSYIRVGQQLRLFPPGGATEPFAPEPVALPPATLPLPEPPSIEVSSAPTFSEPKGRRSAYSESALAALLRAPASAGTTTQLPAPTATTGAANKPVLGPTTETKVLPKAVEAGVSALPDERLSWEWPASGRVIYWFGHGGNKNGVAIAGNIGQAVVSSAAGKVVYSGSGLRGYGKLIIIKHNATYLSVYAHNSQLLVKEGQMVAQGQKIAEMGSTDGGQVALHFEIRRLGKPVDPIKHLPEKTS